MNNRYIKRLQLSWNGPTDPSTPDVAFIGKSNGDVVLAFSYFMAPEEVTESHRLPYGSVKLGRRSRRLFEIAAPAPTGEHVDLQDWLQAFNRVLKETDRQRLLLKGRGRYADALAMLDSKLGASGPDDAVSVSGASL